ncbi:MAG TPA: exodeoxyribonuclease VII small subunit [Drouetiella sp.]
MSQSISLDFETTLGELEKVVSELDGEVKLERALELFDRGMKLSIDCETFLKGAEQKIEILKRTAAGMTTEPFEARLLESEKNQ